jgi:acyl-phosphate glycerol 3-phosphate acyltransferase
MTGIFWIIFSYFLGSIPSGYLIGRFSKKNVLEIGWRKTSGSNVFKNVGKWQGVLTGLLDVLKGYLVVFGAQKIGFSSEVQIFSGVAAICGNNWSVFLKFAGGRGIGTLGGAFLAFSPQILGFSLTPLVLLTLIWNASIGTLLFLATAIFLSVYFNQFGIVGIFIILSLFPIFIKRLSPIKEIKKSKEKINLIRNRLLFDNDNACLKLRIKKIVKPLIPPIIISSKISWKAIKFGVKFAQKPIKEILFPNSEKVVTEIKAEDFKKMMLAAAKKIVLHQEEINKINVWPVADKDTGYNLAATLLGVEGTISPKNYSNFRDLAQDIKEAAMINARGNAGMIYTGYLIEFLDRIKYLEFIDAFHLALAMRKGMIAARNSIVKPVEGTILDVIKAAGEEAFEIARIKKERNIIKVLKESYKISETALKETKEKLKVLKENDVVDAGALGFVKILEAWLESLKGQSQDLGKKEAPFAEETKPPLELEFRYEVICNLKNIERTNFERIKKELFSLGGSLEIIELENKIKFHIHTNFPEKIREKIKEFETLEWRVEDMALQIGKVAKKPLGLVIDEIADLPKEFLEKYGIEEVSFTTKSPDGEIITSKEEIYLKMKEAVSIGRPLPTTSAPSFKEYFSVYQRSLEKFEKILVITVSSKLSGAYSSARIARSIFEKPTKLNIFVFDCNSAEIAEGLIGIQAQELISQGKNLEGIVEKLKEFSPKVTLLACIDNFRYIVQGGRVSLPKIFVKPTNLLQKIGFKVLVFLKNGKVRFSGIRFGKDSSKILVKEIDKQRNGKKIKVAIAHADNLKAAQGLKKELEKKSGIEVLFISSVSPVVGTHTGPGALLVAFYPIS